MLQGYLGASLTPGDSTETLFKCDCEFYVRSTYTLCAVNVSALRTRTAGRTCSLALQAKHARGPGGEHVAAGCETRGCDARWCGCECVVVREWWCGHAHALVVVVEQAAGGDLQYKRVSERVRESVRESEIQCAAAQPHTRIHAACATRHMQRLAPARARVQPHLSRRSKPGLCAARGGRVDDAQHVDTRLLHCCSERRWVLGVWGFVFRGAVTCRQRRRCCDEGRGLEGKPQRCLPVAATAVS